MTIRYGSVCSGVEAATVAWEPLGWRAQWFAEVDKFPSAVLAHRFPNVPNLGDMTGVITHELAADIDLLVGGTPCQSFSVTGLRSGIDDERGNLALEFCRIADAKRPRWIVWENVPGVLSSDGGRAFGSIVGALADIGYRLAWRVLDAQHFGVPQRRRRVFLVGHLGGPGNRAAEVLFEPGAGRGSAIASEGSRKDPAPAAQGGAGRGGAPVATWDPTQVTNPNNRSAVRLGKPCHTLAAAGHAPGLIYGPGFQPQRLRSDDERSGLLSLPGLAPAVPMSTRARSLTPLECERLQGFPDEHTRAPWLGRPAWECPDGPRYKALGNSMSVPVMRWIGERIDAVQGVSDGCDVGENIWNGV